MALTPQIDNIANITTERIELPSKTYKLNIIDNDYDTIIGYVDNLEAMRQAIYHILMVERYSCLIYSNNYGVELQQYIGRDFGYLESTIQETLKDALLYDLRIKDVIVNEVTKQDNDKVNVNFTVYTIYGNLQLEVNINV